MLDDVAADLSGAAALARFRGATLDGAVGGGGVGGIGLAFGGWRMR